MDIIVSLFVGTVVVALLCGTIYVFIKYPKVLVMTIFVAIIIIGMVVSPTVAETFEERTCWVTQFHLNIGCVEVTDEDGYSWLFELGENSWCLNQEFTLKLLPVPELWNDIKQVA